MVKRFSIIIAAIALCSAAVFGQQRGQAVGISKQFQHDLSKNVSTRFSAAERTPGWIRCCAMPCARRSITVPMPLKQQNPWAICFTSISLPAAVSRFPSW